MCQVKGVELLTRDAAGAWLARWLLRLMSLHALRLLGLSVSVLLRTVRIPRRLLLLDLLLLRGLLVCSGQGGLPARHSPELQLPCASCAREGATRPQKCCSLVQAACSCNPWSLHIMRQLLNVVHAQSQLEA